MPVRLVVFDYDQTLSVYHVFSSLAGRSHELQLPPPHAHSERGQLKRVIEANELPQYRSQGGFAVACFGSQQRVEQVRDMLEELKAANVECMIATRGLVGPVRKTLDLLGLLSYFSRVYGNIGNTYCGRDGSLPPYDQAAQAPSALGADERFLGTKECKLSGKRDLIQRLLKERSLTGKDCVFLDDDPEEIKGVGNTCISIQVTKRGGTGGVTEVEIKKLRELLPPVQQSPAGAAESFNVQNGPTMTYSEPHRQDTTTCLGKLQSMCVIS